MCAVLLAACAPEPEPGRKDDVARPTSDVPPPVVQMAELCCERLGHARLGDWYWDEEDDSWEVKLGGLKRPAELDLLPDTTFSELELVYTFEEIEAVLPDVAAVIRSKCHCGEGIFIELSLRQERFLDDLPELVTAWKQSGVVLEFTCPNGLDVEIDARGMGLEKHLDDESD